MTKKLLDRASRGPDQSVQQTSFTPDGGPLPSDLEYQPRKIENYVAWINDRAAWLERKDPTGQRSLPRWRVTVRNNIRTCEPIILTGTASYRQQQAALRRQESTVKASSGGGYSETTETKHDR